MEALEKPADPLISKLSNPIEAVVNILYLIKEERHDPDKILHLASLADAPMEQLSPLVRSGLSRR